MNEKPRAKVLSVTQIADVLVADVKLLKLERRDHSAVEQQWVEGMKDRRLNARAPVCICGGSVEDVGHGVFNPDCAYHGTGSKQARSSYPVVELDSCELAIKNYIEGREL